MSGLQNVSDAQGVAIAITGMAIVFSALIMISLFIRALPKLLGLINELFPEGSGHHGPTPLSSTTTDDQTEIIAAIATALHARDKL